MRREGCPASGGFSELSSHDPGPLVELTQGAPPVCPVKLQPPSHHPHTASALLQVERQITNQTYILRLHVTTQMAQLLFPPRGELEAAHQVDAGWLGSGWWEWEDNARCI